MSMLDSYAASKNELLSILARTLDVCEGESQKKRLRSIEGQINGNCFSIVVVGQFKRGKTTFINALLGAELLPTAVIPLTSIITILKWGEKLGIRAFFSNGSSKEIALEELPLFVTEKHNPKNEKNVDRVEISYPSHYLGNGVQVIDTPGIASVHEHNTRVTYEYLPQADAAIFLVSPDPPLTQSELHFIRDLKINFGKIFFVQSKMDMVSEKDGEEALLFSKGVIEKQAGFGEVIIHPLSAKKALEGKQENDQKKISASGLPLFEKMLGGFLMREKGDILLKSVTKKIQSVASEATLLFELEQKSLGMPLRELEDKIKRFESSLEDIEQERIDTARLLKEEIQELIQNMLVADLGKLKEKETGELFADVEKFYLENRKKGNRELVAAFNEFLDRQIQDIFNTWRLEEERKLNEQIRKILSRFIGRMNTIVDRIVALAVEAFGLSSKSVKIEESLPAETEFNFKLEEDTELLGMTIDFVTKSLPAFLAHRIIRKNALARAGDLVDSHCGLLRHDFSQRLETVVEKYKSSVDESAKTIKEDIVRTLSHSKEIRQDTAQAVSECEKVIQQKIIVLSKIEESIHRLTPAPKTLTH